MSSVLAVGSRLPSSYTRVGASAVPVEAVVSSVLSVSASFLVFTAFCYGGGGVQPGMGPSGSYSLEVYLHDLYFCHFIPFSSLCHFMPFYYLYHFATWHGETYFMPAKNPTLLTTGFALCPFPDGAPRDHLLAVLTPDGMFFFQACPVLSAEQFCQTHPDTIQPTSSRLFCACCASF